jgi:hypothetical protein
MDWIDDFLDGGAQGEERSVKAYEPSGTRLVLYNNVSVLLKAYGGDFPYDLARRRRSFAQRGKNPRVWKKLPING